VKTKSHLRPQEGAAQGNWGDTYATRCSAATIAFTFVDGGEPGTKDLAVIKIQVGGNTVIDSPLSASAFLTFGNQQAHAVTGNKP